MAVTLQPAFVLHRRHYRETSLIVELFTLDYGRIAVVARGVRRAHSRMAALLQPFMPLLVSWYGKGELFTLTQVESNHSPQALWGKNLRCGFYLNELLIRLLPKHDSHAPLFEIYQQTLVMLRDSFQRANERALRLFEKKLLMEIGYGLPLKSALKFNDEARYYFDQSRGFLLQTLDGGENKQAVCLSGKALNALLNENLEDEQSLHEIKSLMRYVLSQLLGGTLESRRLFELGAEKG